MNYKRLKAACYSTNIAMAAVSALSPLLFLTFRNLYNISYTLLGLLVLINFCTQLAIDLIFSFFSHKFNIEKTLKVMPVLATAGFLIYALYPLFFPGSAYIGIAIGTVVFAASGGLAEVLISPTVAAIPSAMPQKEMSKLHSVYAWGVVAVVIFSTVFLTLFGRGSWNILVLILLIIPVTSAVLFAGCEIPALQLSADNSFKAADLLKNKTFLLSFFCIFLGGAAENTMAQWCSSYLEQAFHTPKIWGDVFGVAMFALMLGLGRSIYARSNKSIYSVLLLCSIGTAVCYLCTALVGNPIIGIAGCALTGLCTSMLWPGNLIVAAKRFPTGGVVMYALMAAGGDLGGAAIPQAIGVVTDMAMTNEKAIQLAQAIGISAEQLAMRSGMLIATAFPVVLIILSTVSVKIAKKEKPVQEKKQ